MARTNRCYLTARVSEEEQAMVDLAAKVEGQSRSDFVRAAVLPKARQRVRSLTEDEAVPRAEP